MNDGRKTGTAERTQRRRRKAARPAEISDAALAEFAAHGFAGARLDRIAARAGIAKPTIYLYFKDKEALFAEVVRSRVASTIGEAGAMVSGFEGPTADLLRTFLRLVYTRFVNTELRAILRIVIAEGNRFPELLRLYNDVAIGQGRETIRAVIRRGIARGEVRDGPAARQAELIIAPAVFLSLQRDLMELDGPIDLDTFFEAHLDLLVHGLLR